MVISLFVSLFMVALYVGATIFLRKTLPVSVSAMVYELPAGGWQWLWTVWIWLVALSLAPAAIEMAGLLAFALLACLMFVGVFPLFDKEHKTLHNILGVVIGILSQVIVYVQMPEWLILWSIFLLIQIDKQRNTSIRPKFYTGKGVFISEAICAVTLYGAIIGNMI